MGKWEERYSFCKFLNSKFLKCLTYSAMQLAAACVQGGLHCNFSSTNCSCNFIWARVQWDSQFNSGAMRSCTGNDCTVVPPCVQHTVKQHLNSSTIIWHGISIGGPCLAIWTVLQFYDMVLQWAGPVLQSCSCNGKLYCNVLLFELHIICIV